MKKKLKFEDPAMKPPKAMMQLVDAFTDTYKSVEREEYAEELFPVRRLRDYFQAWPVPKMPDPLPPYLNELERRGYAMQTGYDGVPALFCVRWQVKGEVCTAEETADEARPSPEKEAHVRTGLTSMKALIALRRMNRPSEEDDDSDEEDNEEEWD